MTSDYPDPNAMWGWVGIILSAMLFTFATWILNDGIRKSLDDNKFMSIMLYTIMGIVILISLWNFGVIEV